MMTEEAVLEFADGTKIVEFIDGGCSADDALLNEGSTNDELLGGDKLGSSEAALVEFTDGD